MAKKKKKKFKPWKQTYPDGMFAEWKKSKRGATCGNCRNFIPKGEEYYTRKGRRRAEFGFYGKQAYCAKCVLEKMKNHIKLEFGSMRMIHKRARRLEGIRNIPKEEICVLCEERLACLTGEVPEGYCKGKKHYVKAYEKYKEKKNASDTVRK